MTKAFASLADLVEKKISFITLSAKAYAFTAEDDPNTGVIVGDDEVRLINAQATLKMARGTVFHNFRGAKSIPGLTWPSMVFRNEMAPWMGKLGVRIIHAGAGHPAGDPSVWIPSQKLLFSGALVAYNAGNYTGDAQLEIWPAILKKLPALKPKALVPGRGPALKTPPKCQKAIRYTRDFGRGLSTAAKRAVVAKKSLKKPTRQHVAHPAQNTPLSPFAKIACHSPYRAPIYNE